MTANDKPKRFQAKRGQKLTEGQKLVGRNTRWGNPFPLAGKIDLDKPPRLVLKHADKIGSTVDALVCKSAEESVKRYRKALIGGKLDYGVEHVRDHLRGHDLGCPCHDEFCHAEVLLEIAND